MFAPDHNFVVLCSSAGDHKQQRDLIEAKLVNDADQKGWTSFDNCTLSPAKSSNCAWLDERHLPLVMRKASYTWLHLFLRVLTALKMPTSPEKLMPLHVLSTINEHKPLPTLCNLPHI